MPVETKKYYAGIGNPPPPAFFPPLFNAACHATGKDAEFVSILVKREYLSKFFIKAREFLSGFLVFPPYGQMALPLCDKLTESAKATGTIQLVTIDPNSKQLLGDALALSDAETEQEKMLQICVHAYELWFHEPAPIDTMRKTMLQQNVSGTMENDETI